MTRLRLFVLAAVLVAGCRAHPEPIPVKGRITVNGKPLAHATVLFHPDPERGNLSKVEPRAQITPEDDGCYELQSGDSPGAVPGWYRVTVFATRPGANSKAPEWLANRKYTEVATSGLVCEVKDEDAGKSVDFNLTP